MRITMVILTMITAVLSLLLPGAVFTQKGSGPGLNLEGRWRDEGNGELVDITVSGNTVTSKYVHDHFCKYKDDSGVYPRLKTDFSGTLDPVSKTLKGQIIICFFDKAKLITLSTGPTSLVLDKIDAKSMSGTFETPDRGTQNVTFTHVKSYINGYGRDIPLISPFESDPDSIVPEDACPNELWTFTSYEIQSKAQATVDVLNCTSLYIAHWMCTTNKTVRLTTDKKQSTMPNSIVASCPGEPVKRFGVPDGSF